MDNKSYVGLYGLGVMGQNLALNIGRKGYSVSVYNRTASKTKEFIAKRVKDEKIVGTYDLKLFVESLQTPRIIILMVQAGRTVDLVIESLLPYIDQGDLIIDAGNSHYQDTERRLAQLEEDGYLFMGMGVSGGEYGALHGPSIMPGGSKESYAMAAEVLIKIAAQTEDGPCCAYMGNGSAGHFVKMVHNGIEYAIMQNIAETYDIMRKPLGMSAGDISSVFEQWNNTEFNSYLCEITYKVLRKIDAETGKPLVDLILDEADQKGTGKWTSQAGLDLGIPVPTLSAAVFARILSHFKEYRVEISSILQANEARNTFTTEPSHDVINGLYNACLFATFISFSQGAWLMSGASEAFGYGLNISEVLRVWKGGCIIRAKMLNFLREIVNEDGKNVNLLMSKKAVGYLESKLPYVHQTLQIARKSSIPMPVLSSALDYYYGMTTANLPANLIQAQRDFFGAHTYRRIDKEGIFHTEWE